MRTTGGPVICLKGGAIDAAWPGSSGPPAHQLNRRNVSQLVDRFVRSCRPVIVASILALTPLSTPFLLLGLLCRRLAVAKGNSHAALAYNGKGPPIDGRRHIEYVKMGDECCFKGMGGGIMIGDTALCRLGIEEEPDEHADEGGQSKPSQPFLRYDECVFRLVPMLSYRARQELEVKKKMQ